VLLIGLALYSLAIFLCAVVPWFWFFLPVAVLVGLGNSVFHPSDFTILNASVNPDRLGRAFGIHTLGGNLGWAAAPVTMLAAGAAFGWRPALLIAAAIGVVILLILILNRRVLRDEHDHRAEQGMEAAAPAEAVGLRPLLSRSVVMCFFYFVFLAAALIGIQNFLPTTLNLLHGTNLALAGTVLTGFLLGASAGVLAGGFLADRSDRYGATIFVGLISAAALFLVVGWVSLPAVALVAAVAGAGFLSGVTTPSRDMLVRSATPKGATGRVFGFVYSGLDAGSALAPLLIGVILDHGNPIWVTWIVALAFFAAIFTAVSISTKAGSVLSPTGD
jgi:MFS family permease